MDQQLRKDILARDGGCVARMANNPAFAEQFPMLQDLPEPGPCRNIWSDIISPSDEKWLTIEEIKLTLRSSKKAGYSLTTSVSACGGHHIEGRGPGAKWFYKGGSASGDARISTCRESGVDSDER
jgi:hypothetical protein